MSFRKRRAGKRLIIEFRANVFYGLTLHIHVDILFCGSFECVSVSQVDAAGLWLNLDILCRDKIVGQESNPFE